MLRADISYALAQEKESFSAMQNPISICWRSGYSSFIKMKNYIRTSLIIYGLEFTGG